MMANLRKIVQIVTLGAVLTAGTIATDSLAVNRRDTVSRLWNVCTNKLPRFVKCGVEGALALYAGYIAFNWAVDSMPAAQRLVNWQKPIMPILKELLYKGCIITGLGTLAYKSTNACLNDAENL